MAYLVQSLVNLRHEIDLVWPNRDRRTDGWVRWPQDGISYGHNPDGKGAVHAIDVDKDGIWVPYILDRIKAIRGVIWYAIWDRHIYDIHYGWRKDPYNGKNPHIDHVHIEVEHTALGETWGGHWGVSAEATQTIGSAPYTDPAWGEADPTVGMATTAGHIVGGGTSGVNYGRGIASLRNL